MIGAGRLANFWIVAGLCAIAAGCTSTEVLTSASPQTPFGEQQQAANGDFSVNAPADMPVAQVRPEIDPKHVYSLPELIDIAELNNASTRVAWQRARQAASTVGVSQAAYLPVLSANVLAGYAQTSSIAPGFTAGGISVPDGVLTTKGSQIAPALTISWLLFDFGGRQASAGAAQDLAYAANVSFNGTHQKLIFDVANAYFQLSAARIQTRVNAEALQNSQTVLTATKARQENGIATSIETAQAQQQAAQAKFDLTQAKGTETNAYGALLGAMGVSPTIAIKVQDISRRGPPRRIPADLDRVIEDALKRRPDVLAAFAKAKADKKGIAATKAQFMPKVAITGSYGTVIGDYSVHDSRLGRTATARANQPNASIMLGLAVPIFDGGLRKHQLDAAQANADASEQSFKNTENAAAQEIVFFYNTLNTGLSAYTAASELVRASRTTYDAALDYYSQGLGTLSDVSVAQNGLLKARLSQAKALSDSFSAAASLAFATGTLTNANSVP